MVSHKALICNVQCDRGMIGFIYGGSGQVHQGDAGDMAPMSEEMFVVGASFS